jgi:hypothetical protein
MMKSFKNLMQNHGFMFVMIFALLITFPDTLREFHQSHKISLAYLIYSFIVFAYWISVWISYLKNKKPKLVINNK